MIKKILSLIVAFGFFALSTGCVSGGYKLTRQYSRWVNSQQIIVRIILHILTLPVYAVTLLIDGVIFNTMDFWEGRVSQGSFKFEGDGKEYYVKHEFQGDTHLKQSTIRVMDLAEQKVKEILIKETADSSVEIYMDGKLKQRAKGLEGFAVVSEFDESGSVVKRMPVDLNRRLLALDSAKLQSL